MQRRKFLKSGTTLIGLFPFIQVNHFNTLNTTFLMDADVIKINIGKFSCTIFRDLMFNYLAKDFFINANPEELKQSLKKYNVALENIPSPFIAILLQQNDRKIL